MNPVQYLKRFRDWFPTPTSYAEYDFVRWVLLEGDRLAVAGAILTSVYLFLLMSIRNLDIQVILTETSAVETIFVTFLSGIFLLVSIVVSINSVVLSQDIGSVQNQAAQTRGTRKFRNDVGAMTETGENPSDPRTFLWLMATVIADRAQALAEDAKGVEGQFADDIEGYTESILASVEHLEKVDKTDTGDFDALWTALEVDYGTFLERSRALRGNHQEMITDPCDEQLKSLVESIQVFAIGRENFKTLYYYKEVSVLSRTLLIVSLPAILVIAMALFAINAGRFPRLWLFGVRPLPIFVVTVFTIALLPYVVLTSYMLRLSTVGIRTASAGPFSLND